MCYSLLRFFQKLYSATPLSNILDPRLNSHHFTGYFPSIDFFFAFHACNGPSYSIVKSFKYATVLEIYQLLVYFTVWKVRDVENIQLILKP